MIAHHLLTAFQTHATALGFMSSMYFYLYALEQPLVGYLSDRLGTRRVVGFWALATALDGQYVCGWHLSPCGLQERIHGMPCDCFLLPVPLHKPEAISGHK